MGVVLAAVVWLAPHLPTATATSYAAIIHGEATRRELDPLLMVAIIHYETVYRWDPRSKSSTSDYGLMQCHVSQTTNPEFLGREHLLFDPRRGVACGARMLAMWRRWHTTRCRQRHPYWSHYQFGYQIRNLKWTRKVERLYWELARHFGGAV